MATAAVTYTFVPNTLIKASEANTNFNDLISFLNGQVIHKDASVAFTAIPSGPSSDPTSDDQFARKAYVDKPYAVLKRSGAVIPSGATTAGPITTFSDVSSRGLDTANSRITATAATAGLYLVHASLTFATTSSSGDRGIKIYKNGVSVVAYGRPAGGNGTFSDRVEIIDFIDLADGDYLEVYWLQNSGSSISAGASLAAIKVA